ncbi:MAG: 16S rRNA (guanine(966)-N(2))-methyltransferase RsmD [Verrucomicrobiales bacterium]|jgi:16S rRNA (guanine(966)-N(2))-methyltransferase RsmD|nr:16S rRNA (guanine(966)-N(2))-methyltransferase RsmD [Verrucomicrobiales bacterium]
MSRIRVTTGSAGGLFIKTPPQFHSRPTQDRIKQAIFSSLGMRVPGARVLDLYAGSGSLGIEALSRGSLSATFVESKAHYCKTIEENLAYCKLAGSVVKQDVGSFVPACKNSYDIILADPPYAKEKCDLANHEIICIIAPLLAADGILVWEHDSRNQWTSALENLTVQKTVKYGETSVSYLLANIKTE